MPKTAVKRRLYNLRNQPFGSNTLVLSPPQNGAARSGAWIAPPSIASSGPSLAVTTQYRRRHSAGAVAQGLRVMGFRIVALAIIAAFAYSFQGFDGDHAMFLAALPIVAAVCFILLGPG